MTETLYIPPDTEDYTGYTTYVLMGTGTSESEIFSLPIPDVPLRVAQGEEEMKEYVFPETREERFLDKEKV